MITLGFFGKPAAEVFPGITFTANGSLNIDQIWTDTTYQNAFEEGMKRRIQNEPGKYDWYIQRKEQLEILFKAKIKFQNLSEETSMDLLMLNVEGKTPSAGDIFYNLIMAKIVAYLQTRHPTECVKISELINSASSDILGDVFNLAFQNLRYQNRLFDPVIILFMLHIICDHSLDFDAIMKADHYELVGMIETMLHNCRFQRNTRPGFIVELLLYRRSRKQYPPFIIFFIKQPGPSQRFVEYILNQFKTFTSDQWPSKAKSLIQFLQLIEKSKGHEVVLTLMKEDPDEHFRRIYQLLNSLYITKELDKAYPLLYELFELMPGITSEDIQGIYNISFKPYEPHMLFEGRYSLIHHNNCLIGCYSEGDGTMVAILNLTTNKLEWGIKIASHILHMSMTSRGLTIATTPNSLYFFDLSHEFKKTAFFFPTDLETNKIVNLHITPGRFCFLITSGLDGMSVEGGSLDKSKWRKNFKVSIPQGNFLPLGNYLGIKQNGTVIVVNQFGEIINLDCTDIIATNDSSLYMIQQQRLSNVHHSEEFIELPHDDLHFLAAGNDGTLILSSQLHKNLLWFVNPMAGTVISQDLGFPAGHSLYVDKNSNTVWAINPQTNQVLKCTSQVVEYVSLTKSKSKIVYVDHNENIYYLNY